VNAEPANPESRKLDNPAQDSECESVAYRRALDFLYNRINYERIATNTTARYPFRLHRMRELLRRLGLEKYLYDQSYAHPRPTVPLVHIAGTKGKGSTASMVAAALTAAGLRTGLYTSPHLHCLEERFRIDGLPCSPQQTVQLVEQIEPILAASHDAPAMATPSFFELTTAMALLHFESQRCDAVVLEVGLGGRLDSTNVCHPSVTAITPIGLDHQHVLGNTVTEIAAEKAGIIKSGIPVICGISAADPHQADVIDVIARRAADQGAPLYLLDRDFAFDYTPQSDWGSQVHFRSAMAPLPSSVSLELTLEGRHQASNAAVAIALVHVLASQGIANRHGEALRLEAVGQGIGQLRCDARIERFDLPHDVVVIVDAAHNQDSIAALCQTVKQRAPGRQVTVVFGTSQDKSADVMLRQLAQIADSLVLTQYTGNPRFQVIENLLTLVPESLAARTHTAQDPMVACQLGLQLATPGGWMIVCGSFFLAAETHQWLAAFTTDPRRKGAEPVSDLLNHRTITQRQQPGG